MPPPAASPPRVAVVVLTWNARDDVPACFGALRAAARDGLELLLLAVDNGSTDGTPALVRERFPEVELLEAGANLGYAGGNNLGIRRALERGAEWVFLLNPDTVAQPGFLREAVAVAGADPRAGAVQSLLLLADDPGLVNSAGNEIHFLGFGYCGGLRTPAARVAAAPREIAFASGAAVLYRGQALREVGLLDEALFLYHEDLDLGWRLRLAGWRSLLAPRSRVHHRYAFARNPRKYYYLERNRYWVLLKNASLRTLLLLAPWLAAAEAGLLLLAAAEGWLGEKLRATRDALRPSALRRIRAARRAMAGLRRVEDREVLRPFTARMLLDSPHPPAALRLANGLLAGAWAVLRRLL